MDFKAPPRELWNPLSKTVLGKFHGSGGHRKRNCLQDRANFHRSQAWKIVIILNTDVVVVVVSCKSVSQISIRVHSLGQSYVKRCGLCINSKAILSLLHWFENDIFGLVKMRVCNKFARPGCMDTRDRFSYWIITEIKDTLVVITIGHVWFYYSSMP